MGITCLVIYKRELVLLLMLEAYHASEVTVTAYQLVRRSLLSYTTILKEHDVIGIANRTHTMSNDKDGLIPRQLRDT